MRWLQVPEDRRLDREIALARRRALEAAIGTLDGNASPYADALRLEYRTLLDLHEARDNGDLVEVADNAGMRLRAARAAHASIRQLRTSHEISETAYQRIELAIDRSYLYATRYEAAE